jgi:hypothetical protein
LTRKIIWNIVGTLRDAIGFQGASNSFYADRFQSGISAMRFPGLRAARGAALLCLSLLWTTAGLADAPPAARSRVEAALANIAALDRPGKEGLATVWDGNKYVQCRRAVDRTLRCEAAGALLQSSLSHVLTSERIARMLALGWRLDPSFGNYLQVFPGDLPAGQVADKILTALSEGYDADVANVEVSSHWIARTPCPQRNGPSQNLAGSISDAPSMAATAIYSCAYTASAPTSVRSAAELVDLYGARATGEFQRLRVNLGRRTYVILKTDIGYIQCESQTSPDVIYCEAQSADSWPALESVLTPSGSRACTQPGSPIPAAPPITGANILSTNSTTRRSPMKR